MSSMKDVLYEIQEDIQAGRLSFEQISVKYSNFGLTIADISTLAEELTDNCDDEDDES